MSRQSVTSYLSNGFITLLCHSLCDNRRYFICGNWNLLPFATSIEPHQLAHPHAKQIHDQTCWHIHMPNRYMTRPAGTSTCQTDTWPDQLAHPHVKQIHDQTSWHIHMPNRYMTWPAGTSTCQTDTWPDQLAHPHAKQIHDQTSWHIHMPNRYMTRQVAMHLKLNNARNTKYLNNKKKHVLTV
jgi:hypothetical protein